MFGLRRGDVLGLRWADVDFERGSIRVRHALHRVDGSLQLGQVKTDGSARLLPLPHPLVGNGSPVTTKLIYVDISQDMHRDAPDQLGALFEDSEDRHWGQLRESWGDCHGVALRGRSRLASLWSRRYGLRC